MLVSERVGCGEDSGSEVWASGCQDVGFTPHGAVGKAYGFPINPMKPKSPRANVPM